MKTAVEISRQLGVDPKHFRQWLRDQVQEGNPLVAHHRHNEPWIFSDADAGELERLFLDRHGVWSRSATRLSQSGRSVSLPEVQPSTLSFKDLDFTEAGLRQVGFDGFVSFASLLDDGLRRVPCDPGVYAVVSNGDVPRFAQDSSGGEFKGRDPSVPISELQHRWLSGSAVIYIGKAKQLRRRIGQFARFGRGEAVGHWGGRLIWQLVDPGELRIAWLYTPEQDPRHVEIELLSTFIARFGKRPFANLTG